MNNFIENIEKYDKNLACILESLLGDNDFENGFGDCYVSDFLIGNNDSRILAKISEDYEDCELIEDILERLIAHDVVRTIKTFRGEEIFINPKFYSSQKDNILGRALFADDIDTLVRSNPWGKTVVAPSSKDEVRKRLEKILGLKELSETIWVEVMKYIRLFELYRNKENGITTLDYIIKTYGKEDSSLRDINDSLYFRNMLSDLGVFVEIGDSLIINPYVIASKSPIFVGKIEMEVFDLKKYQTTLSGYYDFAVKCKSILKNTKKEKISLSEGLISRLNDFGYGLQIKDNSLVLVSLEGWYKESNERNCQFLIDNFPKDLITKAAVAKAKLALEVLEVNCEGV